MSEDGGFDREAWERAYRRFETPEEEVRKFLSRLRSLGAHRWDRGLQVLEIFCGRGNALVAWERLGFSDLTGLDLSEDLVATYQGPARTVVADARAMPFADDCRDVVAVHGGLHHLDGLADFERVLDEVARVLRPGGRFLVVEPWLTPFLRFVHWVYSFRIARAAWGKLDALATMNELEADTYLAWLDRPTELVEALTRRFEPIELQRRWGKLQFVGTPRG